MSEDSIIIRIAEPVKRLSFFDREVVMDFDKRTITVKSSDWDDTAKRLWNVLAEVIGQPAVFQTVASHTHEPTDAMVEAGVTAMQAASAGDLSCRETVRYVLFEVARARVAEGEVGE